MLKIARVFTFLLLVFVSFSGCEKINPDEEIPSYLFIDTFTFTTNYLTEGAASEDIVDVWVFIDSDLMGVYELPATIPVKYEGKHTVKLFPGIKINGISQNRDIYSMYQSYERDVTFTKKETSSLSPYTKYKDNVKFEWIEDFEDQALSIASSGTHSSTDTIVLIDNTNPNLFEPGPNSNFSAYINMDTSTSFEIFEHTSLDKWIVPNNEQDVFLEINYKTNVAVQFGIYATKANSYDQIPVVVVLPSTEWKKMYINLNTETSILDDNDKIQIFFGMFNDGRDPDFIPEIYLDNMKLLYLN
jgi:hypothetical protein